MPSVVVRSVTLKDLCVMEVCTGEPRFNKVPGDWGNWFVISRFFSIHFTITELKNIVCYTEDYVI